MDQLAVVEPLGYAAAAILRSRRREFRVLLMKTVKIAGEYQGLELWQLPGGMEEIMDQGNPMRTLDRELHHETGFRLRKNYKDPDLLQKVILPDGHIQRFYEIWRQGLVGELRTQPVTDGDKRLEVPEWKSADFAIENLCSTHRGVIPFLIKHDLRIRGLK